MRKLWINNCRKMKDKYMENKYYIEYDLFFRTHINKNEEIIFKYFNENFIKDIIIKKCENEEPFHRELRINLNLEFLKGKSKREIFSIVDDFLIEFLYKLSLKMQVLFPSYKKRKSQLGNELHLSDTIRTIEKLTIFYNIPENEEPFEDIKFKENISKYKKIIRILETADTDPVTVFMVLYDWFLDWVSQNKCKKQKNVVDYIENRKEEIGYIGDFSLNEKTHINEDDFTKLRNDIGHSNDRNIDLTTIYNRAKNAIKPFVAIMTYFLKNEEL